MGIVVCISMLLGLSVLQPTPWNSAKRANHHPRLVLVTAITLFALGTWNFFYGYLNINGFWSMASMVSGSAMVFASYYVYRERPSAPLPEKNTVSDDSQSDKAQSGIRKAVVAVLALSFLVYAITLVQLNLGYSILR